MQFYFLHNPEFVCLFVWSFGFRTLNPQPMLCWDRKRLLNIVQLARAEQSLKVSLASKGVEGVGY